jgi:hypothetical protein
LGKSSYQSSDEGEVMDGKGKGQKNAVDHKQERTQKHSHQRQRNILAHLRFDLHSHLQIQIQPQLERFFLVLFPTAPTTSESPPRTPPTDIRENTHWLGGLLHDCVYVSPLPKIVSLGSACAPRSSHLT